MLDSQLIERAEAKVILIVLIILEIALIAYSYSLKFDDYISLVVIVLGAFTSYYAFHYLRYARRKVKTFEASSSTQPE